MHKQTQYPSMGAGTRRSATGERGVSLVELMIALLLGVMIVGGMGNLFVTSKRSYKQDEIVARMQESARFAMAMIANDLQMAGFWSPMFDPANATLHTSLSVATDCGPSGAAAPGWWFDLSDSLWIVNNGPTADTNGDDDIEAAFSCIDDDEIYDRPDRDEVVSDVISIKRVLGAQIDDGVNLGATDERVNGKIYLETDGLSGRLFHYTGGAAVADRSYWEYAPAIYYIRGWSNTAADGIPTLVRKVISTGAAPTSITDPLIEGVEDLQIEFGIDANDDGVADSYWSAPEVPSSAVMATAVTARITLLVRSVEPVGSYENEKTYSYADVSDYDLTAAAVSTEEKWHYRRVYTTTLLLRNPKNLNALLN